MTIDVDGVPVEFDPDTVCIIRVDVEHRAPTAPNAEVRLMLDALTAQTQADRGKAKGRYERAKEREAQHTEAAPPPTLRTVHMTPADGERYWAALTVMVRRETRRGWAQSDAPRQRPLL